MMSYFSNRARILNYRLFQIRHLKLLGVRNVPHVPHPPQDLRSVLF